MEDLFELLDVKDESAAKPVAKKTKSNTTDKEVSKGMETKESTKEYEFPFQMHFGGEMHDVNHIFTEGTTYSEKEITEAMLSHQFYEFAGTTTYSFHEEDNVLVPMFQQFKKG